MTATRLTPSAVAIDPKAHPPDHSGATAWQPIGDVAEELARLRYVNQRDAKFTPMLAKLALDEGTDYERAFRNCISTNFDGLLCWWTRVSWTHVSWTHL
jgi:hypothetical protein